MSDISRREFCKSAAALHARAGMVRTREKNRTRWARHPRLEENLHCRQGVRCQELLCRDES